VQRELSVREDEATLIGEELDAADVLDEVLVQAWEQFSQRDRKLPLDLWLVRLADEALDRLSQQVAEVSIDDETPSTGESRPAEPEDWIEQVGYPETMDFSELLSDGPGVDSWDDLDLETRQAHLAELLGTLDRDQRQAFVLSAAHGFDSAEIADFQNRSRDSVEADITQVTESIRQRILDEASSRPAVPVRKTTGRTGRK
jgi:DNA-directed RNA polymerase specialized sigma24 family protein